MNQTVFSIACFNRFSKKKFQQEYLYNFIFQKKKNNKHLICKIHMFLIFFF